MKKLFIILLSILLILSLCSCGNVSDDDSINLHPSAIFDENADNHKDFAEEKDNDFIFSWLSYIELSVTGDRNTKEKYEKYIKGLFENMKQLKVSDVFVHARAFGDALYESELFPESEYISGADFDPLAVVIDIAKQYGITVHAWINPYRIGKTDDMSLLPENHIVNKLSEEEKESTVFASGGKLYLNPCSQKAQKLIIDGAKELLQKYDIGGIHIDDYFYPQDCGDFDSLQYESYVKQGGNLSLADFRRENVSSLVSGLYSAVKQYGKDKLFTVSPCADIEKAYSELYADVYLWCSKEGYADIIIPQIYFGFENEKQPFKSCLESWLKITDCEKVMLVPGLALYKAGQKDLNAGTGQNEWLNNSDVIKRQIEHALSSDCDGFALYSASYINFYETFSADESNNIKSVIQ